MMLNRKNYKSIFIFLQNWLNSLLVDCGIFQGDDARKHPNPEIEFSLRGIECLLLTHVHIDHAGRLPYLLAAGFKQPIYCSQPTARLLPLVMEDALKIGFTRSRQLIERFLKHIGQLLQPLPYHQWHAIEGAGLGDSVKAASERAERLLDRLYAGGQR